MSNIVEKVFPRDVYCSFTTQTYQRINLDLENKRYVTLLPLV